MMDESKFAWRYSDASGQLIIGVDIGKIRDFTAIVVVERMAEHFRKAFDGKTPDQVRYHHHVRHFERLKLGTTYTAVCDRIEQMVRESTRQVEFKPREWRLVAPDLVVDNTGVGRPITDVLLQRGLKPISVNLTGGMSETKVSYKEYNAPKHEIMSAFTIVLQDGRFKVAEDIEGAEDFIHELVNFRMKRTESGHETFGADKESTHDDLVIAAALAVWWGDRRRGIATITELRL